MEIYRDHKTRLAEEITIETNIRILSLKMALASDPTRIELEDAAISLTDSREEFLLKLSDAQNTKDVMHAQDEIESALAHADAILDMQPRQSCQSDFWEIADFWMGRNRFDAETLCAEIDHADLMPY
jgi:hypothetical protein